MTSAKAGRSLAKAIGISCAAIVVAAMISVMVYRDGNLHGDD